MDDALDEAAARADYDIDDKLLGANEEDDPV